MLRRAGFASVRDWIVAIVVHGMRRLEEPLLLGEGRRRLDARHVGFVAILRPDLDALESADRHDLPIDLGELALRRREEQPPLRIAGDAFDREIRKEPLELPLVLASLQPVEPQAKRLPLLLRIERKTAIARIDRHREALAEPGAKASRNDQAALLIERVIDPTR